MNFVYCNNKNSRKGIRIEKVFIQLSKKVFTYNCLILAIHSLPSMTWLEYWSWLKLIIFMVLVALLKIMPHVSCQLLYKWLWYCMLWVLRLNLVDWVNGPNCWVSNCVIIGASLSEPHTSMTSLRTCMSCLDRPLTINFKWARLNFNITKIEPMHSVGDREGLLPECSIGLPGVEMTEVEAHMANYSLFINSRGCPQAVQILITMVIEWSLQDVRLNGTSEIQLMSWLKLV